MPLAAPGRRAERLGPAQGAGRCRPSRPGRQISRRARLDPPQGSQIQLAGEFRPRKSKQNQIKPRKNAWICLVLFVRIGTFQGVTANPNRKIFYGPNSPSGLCAKCLRRALLSSPRSAAASRRLDSGRQNIISTYFWFCRANSPCRLRPDALQKENHGIGGEASGAPVASLASLAHGSLSEISSSSRVTTSNIRDAHEGAAGIAGEGACDNQHATIVQSAC